jgi:tetratricopeptide (TPR) repeat protein
MRIRTAFFLCILFLATFVRPIHGLLQSQAPDRQRIEAITRELTAPEFNGRAFKTEEGSKTAGYIAKLFFEAGLRFVLKSPGNEASQARIDEVLLELKRHQNRPVQDPKAREAVILRTANIAFYIANPNGVEYDSLLNQARHYEESGQRQQAIAAYRKLLKFIEDEYARDDQTVMEIRERLSKLSDKQPFGGHKVRTLLKQASRHMVLSPVECDKLPPFYDSLQGEWPCQDY